MSVVVGMAVVLATPSAANAGGDHGGGGPELLADLESGSGSAIGPDGALYVTDPAAAAVARIDRRSGETTLVADCLPDRAVEGVAGAMDVAFLDSTMYVLTAVVGPDVGGSGVTGIYRVHDDNTCEVVADIGAWSIENPPPPDLDYFVTSGVPYAMQPFRGGFLVTDGHLNRVLGVTLDGDVRLVLQLGNVVPTGLDRRDGKIVLSLAGPVPHEPEDGHVVTFRVGSPDPRLVAAGGRLLVDVEFGRHALYALAQGVFPEDAEPGAPALPDTGRLLRADGDGGFDVVARKLDQPTSLEIVHGTAYVVTLNGEVWRINLSGHHDD